MYVQIGIFSLFKMLKILIYYLGKPLTGRTHQIRIHLAFLGHPIANDPQYGHRKGDELLSENFVIPPDTLHTDTPETMKCTECGDAVETNTLSNVDKGIWLHSYRFCCDDWDFCTDILPDWAHEDYVDSL